MSFAETFKMAVKNIAASKTRTFLTMLGIIIGVAAVMVIVGLGNGMEGYITDSFKSMGTDTLTVNIMGRGSSRSVSEEQMYALVEDNTEYFSKISPTVTMNSTVKIGNETSSTTSVTGIGEDYLDIKHYTVADGRNLMYADMLKRNSVCLVGSYINKEYYGGNALGDTIKIGGRSYTIAGVMDEEADSESSSTDDAVYIPYSTAARLSFTGTVNSYLISVVSEDNIDKCVTIVENYLYDIFGDDDSYMVVSMSEVLDTMTSMVNLIIGVLAGIAGISLAVGGIGIMNIMLVSVTERTREIGIRKALGAKESVIMRQFVMESGVTSGLGGIFGIIIGYALSAVATVVVERLMETSITVAPSLFAVAVAFGISVGIGIIFGYLPAKKAAALNPIDALRYD